MEIVKEQPEWFRKALEVNHKSDFAEISGAKVHFMEWGSPLNPSVIMLHGNHAHAHWFQFIGGLLVDKYHFVVMSFSGMGESEWRSSYDKDTFIADVLGVVKATNLVRPVIVGHSFGGMVALATADKYSEDMSGLILVDFVVRRPENHIDWYKNLPPSKAPKIRPSKEELVKRFRLMPPQECKNQFLLDFIAERSVRKTDQGWSWTFDPSTYDHLDVGNNQSEVLNQLNCPVSFMYGENTMEFDTGNSIKEMKELLPKGSSVVALKEAQHHLMLDKPLEFVEELDKLIQEFVQ